VLRGDAVTTPLYSEKIEREKEFHNQWARSVRLEELLVRETFEAPTAVENRYALSQLGDIRGKKILDLGCGAGETSTYLALQGAEVYACDIAEDFLVVAKSLGEKYGVKLNLVQADSANLPYPDEFFDGVFANGVLHHVELVPTAKELRRVMKKGARAVFIEPLPYNPVIGVYRRLAEGVRTKDEKPLSFKAIGTIRPYFSEFGHKEFWFVSLLIFLHFFFMRRWNPSKIRYWKKVIEEGASYEKMFSRLQKCDEFLLRTVPFLNYLCWNTVIRAVK